MQKNKRVLSWMFLLAATLLFSCKAKYSFTGASLPPDVKTISVKYFNNNASIVQPVLSQRFTEALKNIFTTQTSLTLVPEGGDLHFEGFITSYVVSPEAIQTNDNAAQNRLTISVNVKFVNNKDEKQNFEQQFSRYQLYDSKQSLSSVEGGLIDDINKQLTQDIFNKAVINW